MEVSDEKKELSIPAEPLPVADAGVTPPTNLPAAEAGRAEPNEVFFGGLLIFCLAISLVAATGYFGLAGYRYFKQIQMEQAVPSISSLSKIDTAGSSETEKSAVVSKSETAESQPATESVTIDKKTLEIKVLNGGSAKGMAGTYAEKLKQAGFTRVEVGNAFGDYTGQTLYYAKGQEAGMKIIQAEVMKAYPSLVTKEAPTSDRDAAVAMYVVILGR